MSDNNVRPLSGRGGTKKVITIDEEPREQQSEADARLHRLFESLGSGGWIVVWRRGTSRDTWQGKLPATEEITSNIEETLMERWGGGSFVLKGFTSARACVATAAVDIDEKLYPPKYPGQETKAQDSGLGKVLEQLLQEQREARARDDARYERLMQQQANAQRGSDPLMVELIRGFTAMAAASRQPLALPPASDPMAMMDKTFDIVRKAKDISSEGDSGPRTMGARIVESVATRATDRVVDRMMDKFDEEDKTKTAAAKPGEPVRAPLSWKPVSKALTKEQLEAMMVRKRARAPRAADVLDVKPTEPKEPRK